MHSKYTHTYIYYILCIQIERKRKVVYFLGGTLKLPDKGISVFFYKGEFPLERFDNCIPPAPLPDVFVGLLLRVLPICGA